MSAYYLKVIDDPSIEFEIVETSLMARKNPHVPRKQQPPAAAPQGKRTSKPPAHTKRKAKPRKPPY